MIPIHFQNWLQLQQWHTKCCRSKRVLNSKKINSINIFSKSFSSVLTDLFVWFNIFLCFNSWFFIYIPHSCMHPKLWLLFFTDRLRIVISSANLSVDEWQFSTEQIWIQDFPKRESFKLKSPGRTTTQTTPTPSNNQDPATINVDYVSPQVGCCLSLCFNLFLFM